MHIRLKCLNAVVVLVVAFVSDVILQNIFTREPRRSKRRPDDGIVPAWSADHFVDVVDRFACGERGRFVESPPASYGGGNVGRSMSAVRDILQEVGENWERRKTGPNIYSARAWRA